MSDTPRTDAKRGFYDLDTAVDAEFSEELERELNAAYERIQQLIGERDTARSAADQNWNLRREFESLLKTTDITTGIGVLKTLIQASKDNVELRQQVKEQKARIKRLAQSCVAKDEQLCNLLEICRSNGIEVSSQDLINGREGK